MEIFGEINLQQAVRSGSESLMNFRYYRYVRRIGEQFEYAKTDHIEDVF